MSAELYRLVNRKTFAFIYQSIRFAARLKTPDPVEIQNNDSKMYSVGDVGENILCSFLIIVNASFLGLQNNGQY